MHRSFLLPVAFTLSIAAFAQGVGINNPTPNASALLDLTSTDKGLLVPRMTTVQRNAIPLPATSLLIFNTTNARFEYFDGAAWVPLVVSGGTLDQAYDFGGAGAGRTIVADAGAVTITGTGGLLGTGVQNSGALAPTGAGVRMMWYPRKVAFRAGMVTAGAPTTWDDANIGQVSTAFGMGTIASGGLSMAWGASTQATAQSSTAWGLSSQATEQMSTAWGFNTRATGIGSTAWGQSNGGSVTIASGQGATAFGTGVEAPSYCETAAGLNNTLYTPTSSTGYSATDRLFTIGNGTTAGSRSDAIVVLKNGNTGIGVSAPTERLHVGGRTLFQNGFNADNAALLYRSNTDYMFLGPQSGSSANGAAIALFGSTNNVGGNPNGMDVNVPGGSVRLNHTGGSFVFRSNSTSGYTATMELNDTGFLIGHNSAGRNIHFATGGGERMRIEAGGNVAIGNIAPTTRLDVDGQIRIRGGTPATGRVLTSDATGTATWATPGTFASGTLDQAYDFGGAGAGRIITADAGAVRIQGTDGFVSTGTQGTGSIPATGAGIRMMWYPSKAAFRSGRVTGTQWDDVNIGTCSAAVGNNNTASGFASFAAGQVSEASGGSSSVTGGAFNTASGDAASAWGQQSTASGPFSTAWGAFSNVASGRSSTAWGDQSAAPAYCETTLGHWPTLYVPISIIDIQPGDRLFTIGNGTGLSNRNNALTILKNGNTGINTANPAVKLHVNGGIAATPATATANAQPFNYAPGDRTYVRMGSNNTPLNRVVVLANGLTPGQILIVECTATGANGLGFADGANINVGGTKQLLNEDTITLIWNGTKWILTSYANN